MRRKRHKGFSRTIKGGMESVQLSTSITLAQDGVRAAIAESFGCRLARFDHWEILLPPKKGEAELNDSDGALLKGELANDVATRYREGELPPFGRHIYNQKEVAYRVEHELGIEMRYIFFRATAVLEGKNGAHVWLAVRAIVQVWAISGWWNRADIKMWTGLNHGRGPILFGSYSFYDRLEDGHEKYIPVPPAFLSFR